VLVAVGHPVRERVLTTARSTAAKSGGVRPGLARQEAAQEDRADHPAGVSRQAIKHHVIITVLSLVIQLPLSLGIALLLNRKFRGGSFLRLVIFAPYVLHAGILERSRNYRCSSLRRFGRTTGLDSPASTALRCWLDETMTIDTQS